MSGEPGELQVALYDFLYRDAARFASYYAQMFRGRLASLEETDSDKETKDQSAGLNAAVVSGSVKAASETQTSSKRIIDPHDLITTDALSHLIENRRIREDVKDAPHGSLVIAKGTLVFVDKYMVKVAVKALEFVAKPNKKPRTEEEINQARGVAVMKALFSELDLPSAFLLQSKGGVQVAGTIKDGGMEEPISTYYFKHGTSGLADVYAVGIKEVASLSFEIPNTQLIGAGKMAAQGLSDILFPPEAIRITPIALFRKL